ncbi:MAG: hypothetical protein JO269_03820 [Burkholderiaceae bacterium]|nr:hypothetical protein [Burkholderiaceae bacterium]
MHAVADPADSGGFDLLDYHGAPASRGDHSFNIFFDSGAWHGYSLPPASEAATGFVGPFIHSLGKGQWEGSYFAHLALRDADSMREIVLAPDASDIAGSHAAPGYLRRVFAGNDLKVEQTLFFPDSWHAVVKVELNAASVHRLQFAATARAWPSGFSGPKAFGDGVEQRFSGTRSVLSTRLVAANGEAAKPAVVSGNEYSLALEPALTVGPGRPAVVFIEQRFVYDSTVEQPPAVDYAGAWQTNRARWAGYLAPLAAARLQGLSSDDAHRIAAKAVVTLIGNWRAARGDLHHGGVIPSYSDPNYNGFWAWDSWKHVAALASVAPDLAREQMLAMFDYQAANGMVPDCIFLDKSGNNARDSKPPLASWAALRVFQATDDRTFIAAIYDKLVRYHRWWAAERDHAHDGLAEYGATDGTRIAAAWESGMDNAARFDHIAMLRNGPNAWSADQQSVDLNAYLYEEKQALAELAGALGKDDDRQRWLHEAEELKAVLQARMYDAQAGYFFDRKLTDGSLVHIFGPEGWIPLWAGAASAEQAQHVAAVMLDPQKFATKLPFPSLAADDARFSPVEGYWRGSVWIDQAYFAIAGLRRYGFARDADVMALRLVTNADGLAAQTPFHEVYDPLTGKGLHAQNFSWSAAHFLMLLQD